tara:strand:- start:188 stop:607 length:420 start_codon:yes stop_codon:yes gene_type:complete
MKFKDFIEKGQVRTASVDKALAKSLIKNTKEDLKFLDSLTINEQSSRKLMVNYYESLRSVLEAIAAIDKYKIYSHEAFTYFLKEKNEEIISNKFDRFRKIRNSINYYGEDISIEDTKENIKEIKRIIKILLDKYLKDIR